MIYICRVSIRNLDAPTFKDKSLNSILFSTLLLTELEMDMLYTIVSAFMVHTVLCNDTGVKRLVFDGTVNATELLLKLSAEVCTIFNDHDSLILFQNGKF